MPRASPYLYSVESGPSLLTAGLSRCPPKEAASLHPWHALPPRPGHLSHVGSPPGRLGLHSRLSLTHSG